MFFITFLKAHGNTGQRTAGANSTDKAVNLTISLFPDFRGCGVNMALTVGDIVKLVGPDGAIGFGLCQFFGQTTRYVNIVVLIAIGDSRNFTQISAQKTQKIFFLLALGFRNNNDGTIAKRIANSGKADAGIACCSFDDNTARLQKAARLGVANDGKSSTVFDRSARVCVFRLAKNGAARQLGNLFKLHKRGAANGFDGAIANIHDRLQTWLVKCD